MVWYCVEVYTLGFLLVFSVTEEKTFLELDGIRNQILQVKDVDQFPTVILGNKCDLEEQREVTFEMAKQRANEWVCDLILL